MLLCSDLGENDVTETGCVYLSQANWNNLKDLDISNAKLIKEKIR